MDYKKSQQQLFEFRFSSEEAKPEIKKWLIKYVGSLCWSFLNYHNEVMVKVHTLTIMIWDIFLFRLNKLLMLQVIAIKQLNMEIRWHN